MLIIHIIEAILILFNLVFIILFISRKFNCDKIIDTLNSNIDLLNAIYEKQHSNDLRKMIELYSEVQTIMKLTEAHYISLFKYDFSKKYVVLHFMFSINKTGEIIHESYLDKLPATSNMLSLEILKSNDEGLHSLTVDDVKEVDMKAYQLLKYRNIEKMYFKNITKNANSPAGYLSFSYNYDYKLNEQQEEETLRILKKISDLI